MKIVSTATHAIIDCFTALILLTGPWLMGFASTSPETWVFVITGISIILYNLLTNHELGALKVIPMSVHVWIDMAAGVFLIVSPWLFGFADRACIPHVIVGLFEFTALFFSQTIPSYQESTSEYKKYI